MVRWPWKRTAEEPPAFPTSALPDEPERFVDSGRTFFATAWADDTDDDRIEAFAVQTEAERRSEDELTRQLSRRPRGVVIALAAVALLGGVLGVGVWQGWFESEGRAPGEEGVVFEAAIAAPTDPRSYAGDALPQRLPLRSVLERGLRTTGEGPELLATLPDSVPAGVSFTPILWGNRLQVLVTGPTAMMADGCLIVALVADDLRALDVASRGEACADIHRITGDRASCSGDGIELVEVWPPIARTDLLEAPEAVERIRVRFERSDDDGATLSVRGELDLRGTDLLDLPVVGGEPGTTFRATSDGAARECELLDRSQVEIKVL